MQCQMNAKQFIPQNWIKSKNSIAGIQASIINLFSYSDDAEKMVELIKMDPKYFSYRVQAADD